MKAHSIDFAPLITRLLLDLPLESVSFSRQYLACSAMVLTLHHVDEALARDEGALKKVWVVSFRVAWLNEVWESMIGRAESVQ